MECVIPECLSTARPYPSGRGLCPKHFTRWYRHGDPLYGRGAHNLEDRLAALIDASGDCWEWTGTITAQGYGQLRANGRLQKAHRFVYEWLVGPIPDGLTLDHLCRNRRCVNPEHMEPVSLQTNLARGMAKYRTGRDERGRYV
jgi:hypothetical protein